MRNSPLPWLMVWRAEQLLVRLLRQQIAYKADHDNAPCPRLARLIERAERRVDRREAAHYE